jgi:hypothetical protein
MYSSIKHGEIFNLAIFLVCVEVAVSTLLPAVVAAAADVVVVVVVAQRQS